MCERFETYQRNKRIVRVTRAIIFFLVLLSTSDESFERRSIRGIQSRWGVFMGLIEIRYVQYIFVNKYINDTHYPLCAFDIWFHFGHHKLKKNSKSIESDKCSLPT